ncbi:MAG: Hsp20 family protein [Rhizobiales bacterium]|nr:Hsp20 family protein [Hyphomicrobiales bacterium]
MTRLTAFSSPFLLGFEHMEEMFDRVARSSGDAYPPYNVERVAANGDAEKLRITLAVAGFDQSELTVEMEASTLTIRGDQSDDPERTYLHRGIAARRFERSFVLADGMEVDAVRLESGLLMIDLNRRAPESNERQIPITVGE